MITQNSSPFSRRIFLKNAGLGIAACALQEALPRTFASAALATVRETPPRALVLIHLQGGHDGYSTLIPYQDDRYHRLRPTLAPRDETLARLNETLALSRAGRPLEALFKDGKLSIVLDASYSQPSESHTRSSEIWHTASTAEDLLYSGWIGRCFSHWQSHAQPVRAYYSTLSRPRVFAREEDRHQSAGTEFRHALATSCQGPLTALAEVGERAGATECSEIFFVSVPGFDTHARQSETQPARLHAWTSALRSVQRRFEQRGVADRVLTIAFSEFGRSLKENAQGGTDHGGASPVFLLGPNVRGGIHGKVSPYSSTPDCREASQPDFRRVIRTVVTDWLRLPSTAVFPNDPGRLDLVNTRTAS